MKCEGNNNGNEADWGFTEECTCLDTWSSMDEAEAEAV